MRGGIWFQPFQVIKTETLVSSGDTYTKIVSITFRIDGKDNTLGFGQPETHIKIKRPNSFIRSKTYSISSSKEAKGSFEITVKVYKNGNVSKYLGDLKEGDSL
jgi:NAD(P)H-flavin reductase